MKIIQKKPAGVQPVYDIGVSGPHNFRLANGVIASNCFNKSHAISYSVITYACAWLKANHPQEFFCALMSTRSTGMAPKDWAAKAPQYLNEARQLGVNIYGPSINQSEIGFSIVDNSIYFGLNAIKGVGKTAAQEIIRSRNKRPFTDVMDFLRRVNRTKINRGIFTALVIAGTFDRLGYIRSELLANADKPYDYFIDSAHVEEQKLKIILYDEETAISSKLIEERDMLREKERKSSLKRNPGPQLSVIEESRLNELNEMNLRRKVRPKDPDNVQAPEVLRSKRIPITVEELISQADYIGCYVAQHPASIVFPGAELIASIIPGDMVKIAGCIYSEREFVTSKGDKMAVYQVGDHTANAEVVLFPNTYARLQANQALPSVGKIVQIAGKCEAIDPLVKIIANGIEIY